MAYQCTIPQTSSPLPWSSKPQSESIYYTICLTILYVGGAACYWAVVEVDRVVEALVAEEVDTSVLVALGLKMLIKYPSITTRMLSEKVKGLGKLLSSRKTRILKCHLELMSPWKMS